MNSVYPPKRKSKTSNSQASTRKKMQAKYPILERVEVTEQLLADLEDSPDDSQTPTATPSDRASPFNQTGTTPPSRQLSAGNGAQTKKSKVTSVSFIRFILNTIFY